MKPWKYESCWSITSCVRSCCVKFLKIWQQNSEFFKQCVWRNPCGLRNNLILCFNLERIRTKLALSIFWVFASQCQSCFCLGTCEKEGTPAGLKREMSCEDCLHKTGRFKTACSAEGGTIFVLWAITLFRKNNTVDRVILMFWISLAFQLYL